MGGQWTEEDPGAGSTGTLQSLATQLGKVAGVLDTDQTDIQRALGVFPDSWSGLAASAAKVRIEGLKKQAGALAGAAESVKKAVQSYATEIDAIKTLAGEQITIRDAAKKREQTVTAKLQDPSASIAPAQRQELEAELKEAVNAKDGAVASLSRLAKRRQEADDIALKSVRSVIAEHWDVPPGDWPNERSGTQQCSYTYDMKHPLGVKASRYSAKELMDLFKAHPTEIFPFTVKGPAGGFTDGALFELSKTLGLPIGQEIETGDVTVQTTGTSVKFTVVSDGYFDGPGSTIEFSIVEEGGEFYLRQIADAGHVDNLISTNIALSEEWGIWFLPGPGRTWDEQAENFAKVIRKYGK